MRSQSGWQEPPISLYDAVQRLLDVGDRLNCLRVCKGWARASADLTWLWEALQFCPVVHTWTEGLTTRLQNWLQWVSRRGPTVRFLTLNLWTTTVPAADMLAMMDVWPLLGFSLGRCAAVLERLDMSLPAQLPSCLFLGELATLQQLRIKCPVASSRLFEGISRLTALTSLQLSCLWVIAPVCSETDEEILGGRLQLLPPRLQRVQLDGALLTSLPTALCQLTGLTELQLPNNAENIDEEFRGAAGWRAVQLCTLDLSNCGLEDLPCWLSTLSSLTELNLSNNALDALEDEEAEYLSALRQLRRLDVAKTQWEELPHSLLQCTTLRHLSMHSSPAPLAPGPFLKGLTSLHLGWNQLAACVPELVAATALRHLHIRRSAWPEEAAAERGCLHSVHGDIAATVLATVAELPSLTTLVLDFGGIKPCSMAALEVYHQLRSQRPEVLVRRQLRIM